MCMWGVCVDILRVFICIEELIGNKLFFSFFHLAFCIVISFI